MRAADFPNPRDRGTTARNHYTHRVLWVLVLGLVALTQGAALAQLPKPTNPNLVRLGYYFVNEKYGDDTAEVWPYTNLYIAIPYNAADLGDPTWQTPFAAQLQKATVNHKAIYLILGGCLEASTPGEQCPQVYWDAILDVAQNYWGQVAWLEVAHEEDLVTPEAMESRIQYLRSKLASRGLTDRPFGAIFTTTQILTTNAIAAPSLSFVNIEAYLNDSGDTPTNINNLNAYLATAKGRVRSAGKWIFLTGQAYDRAGGWPDITRLEAIQRPVYLNAYNDTHVIGIQMFAFNRPTGTKDHPELKQAHREIGSVMGISPKMNIDIPSNGATVGAWFHLGGWAIDRAAFPTGGTGVSYLHVWAFPTNGNPPIFAGTPSYGASRPDVGGAFGSQFTFSGFNLGVTLPPGQYWLVAYPFSSVSQTFVKEQVILINVQ